MSTHIFPVTDRDQYRKAGESDLIELLPAPGGNPLYLPRGILDSFVAGIVSHRFIHLSGPTGTAKTALINALRRVPGNFEAICEGLGFEVKPLKVFATPMSVFDSPGDFTQRRAAENGTTYDEPGILIKLLKKAAEAKGKAYPLLWLKEIGRVLSANIQSGLVEPASPETIDMPDGSTLDGSGIAWVADSNYQAEHDDSDYTLVTFDPALKRRFLINLTVPYLPSELELEVLKRLLQWKKIPFDEELVGQVVVLGRAIRRHQAEGALHSVPAATIDRLLAFFEMVSLLPHLSHQWHIQATLLGHASTEDQKLIPSLLNEAFGLQMEEEDTVLAGTLF